MRFPHDSTLGFDVQRAAPECVSVRGRRSRRGPFASSTVVRNQHEHEHDPRKDAEGNENLTVYATIHGLS